MPRLTRDEPAPGVVVLTMSRPEKFNAMDEPFFAEFTDVMRCLGVDDDVRAVVLTGKGPGLLRRRGRRQLRGDGRRRHLV